MSTPLPRSPPRRCVMPEMSKRKVEGADGAGGAATRTLPPVRTRQGSKLRLTCPTGPISAPRHLLIIWDIRGVILKSDTRHATLGNGHVTESAFPAYFVRFAPCRFQPVVEFGTP